MFFVKKDGCVDMKIASLFKGTLLALNVLLLLDVLPAAIAQIQALAANECVDFSRLCQWI